MQDLRLVESAEVDQLKREKLVLIEELDASKLVQGGPKKHGHELEILTEIQF